MNYQAPRGTQDFLPKDTKKWQLILDTSRQFLENYSYKQIITPIFENTELFQRSVGESSDIVNKEMYTFLDRSDRSLTLRPEATAGVIRAYIENGLHREPKPVKLWTYGPMFRYERAQTGRYRQFHQINAEVIGDKSIASEVEAIYLISNIFNSLGIDYRIEINSLGDAKSKQSYKDYFKKYTMGFLNDLCDDCKRRYEQNPLRMLDCKVKEDQEIYASAKKPIEFLSEESQKRWDNIKSALDLYKDQRKIKNIFINPSLVRGLDYYNDFVFEVVSTSEILKGQSTICGGGKYDNLIEQLGGESTPGFGFAIGIERVLLLIKELKKKENSILVLSNQTEIFSLINDVVSLSKDTELQLNFEHCFNPNKIGKEIESALKKGIEYVIFYLDDEKINKKVKIKNLSTREEIVCNSEPEDIINTINKSKVKN